MGFDQYHEPPEELSQEIRTFARMITSLIGGGGHQLVRTENVCQVNANDHGERAEGKFSTSA